MTHSIRQVIVREHRPVAMTAPAIFGWRSGMVARSGNCDCATLSVWMRHAGDATSVARCMRRRS